jgi:hypothetical protein
MIKEQWKKINGFEGFYEISSTGKIKSLSRKMWNGIRYWKSKEIILKPHLNNRGYYDISLRKNGKRKLIHVHRLVAEAFIPNPKNKKEVNHLGKKNDNSIEKLEWVTSKENVQHAFRTKRINHCGEKNGNAKLNWKLIRYIRKEYGKNKISFRKLGKRYGVSGWNISQIIKGELWSCDKKI